VNKEELRAIWAPKDSRETADDCRRMAAFVAVYAPEYANVAPVIDIKTRQRIA
jgi:hypothetical protein